MFTQANWREKLWADLEAKHSVDVLIIGGGIVGAGLFMEASRAGLNTLLVEQQDFASGTSSRSSKMVHGGLRYLAQKRIRLTRDSVRERQKLLRDAPGLVEPRDFYYADYGSSRKEQKMMKLGLRIYDHIAGIRSSKTWSKEKLLERFKGLSAENLNGGFSYLDAATDDARLVFRVISEGISAGGRAINYAAVEAFYCLGEGKDQRVGGAIVRNLETQQSKRIKAKLVINATGAWVDGLRAQLNETAKMRPLRGSHLVLAADRLPTKELVGFLHPRDQRPLFVYPWEGVLLLGTTDVDHEGDLNTEPRVAAEEIDYLFEAVNQYFPTAKLERSDVISCWAGVRPVVDTGEENPSDEPRHHEVWLEKGLLTVTGGKLTTFRLTAIEALNKVRSQLPGQPRFTKRGELFAPLPSFSRKGLSTAEARRLGGRYGALASTVVDCAKADELTRIPGTETHWFELRWAARNEAVLNLYDLLLRRTRIGWLLADGLRAELPRIREIVQSELRWDDARWTSEQTTWLAHWDDYYRLPL